MTTFITLVTSVSLPFEPIFIFLSAYESEWALDEKGERTYHHLEFFPIIARRDKKRNILFRFIDRQKKNFNRRINKIKKIFNI